MKFLFLLLDFCAFSVIMWSVFVLRGYVNSSAFERNVPLFAVIFLFVTFVLWLFSFYDIKQLRKRMVSYKMLSVAWLICLLGCSTMIYFVSSVFSIPTPKRLLLIILTVYYVYICLMRRNYFKLDFAKKNVLIFGQSETISALVKEMKSSRGFRIRGVEPVPAENKHYSLNNLDIVVTGSRLFKEYPQAWEIISRQFISKGIVVDTDFNVYERMFRRVSRESIADSIWLLRGIGNRHEYTMYDDIKRAFDVIASIFLLPILIPLGLFIWVAVRIIDGYPPLFIQKRVGQLEKPIYIYKFRTIVPGGTEENITKCGRFLRRFRLDEIPQVINVLKGDISFVGPRPIWENEYDFLNKYVPNHNIRTIVKPGITGWAQLNFKAPPTYFNFRNEAPEELDPHAFDAAFTRLSYDVWYIKNRSIMLDIEIMLRTGLRMFIKDTYVA